MAKAKKPVAARGKRPKAKSAENKVNKEAASKSLPTLEQLVAVLVMRFQGLLGSRAIRGSTDLRYEFSLSASAWIGFAGKINATPAIRAAGLSITREQMQDARTIEDVAIRLLAGPGLPPVLKDFERSVRLPVDSDPFDFGSEPVTRGAPRSVTAEPRVEKDIAGSDPDPPASFFFSLDGAARGDEALWGGEFDLLFLYGRASDGALAIIKETKLDPVKKGEVALGVEVIPSGHTLAKGGAFQLVRFKDGAMVGKPRFALKAPEQLDAEDDPVGVYVNFSVAGAIIYSVFLPIRLVDKLADSPRPGRTIDLDLEHVSANKKIEPRNARFSILKKGGPWQVSGSVFDAGSDPEFGTTTLISEASLDAAYKDDGILENIRSIAEATAWRFVDARLDLPEENQAAALTCMQKTMTVGYKLYRRFSEDPVFKKVIDLIEALPDGSKITIQTDREAFPWELFYPLHYVDNDRPDNFQPGRFWGNRFLFESLLLPTSDGEKLPARRQQAGKLNVSMGLNSGIDTEEPWVGQTPLPVRVQMDFFDTSLKDRGRYFDKYADIRNILLQADPASLIYFFCHGTAKELKFDNVNPTLTADNVDGGPDYPGWPVIFINACEAGEISPFSFYSFRSEFRKRKAAGLIAPSFPVPTMFAAMFANAFLASYSNKQQVGKILLNLRRELLAKNNPLGLWYSLQCPLDVRAPEL
jgi:hypothetical protein